MRKKLRNLFVRTDRYARIYISTKRNKEKVREREWMKIEMKQNKLTKFSVVQSLTNCSIFPSYRSVFIFPQKL